MACNLLKRLRIDKEKRIRNINASIKVEENRLKVLEDHERKLKELREKKAKLVRMRLSRYAKSPTGRVLIGTGKIATKFLDDITKTETKPKPKLRKKVVRRVVRRKRIKRRK